MIDDNGPWPCNCADKDCPIHKGSDWCKNDASVKVEVEGNNFRFCRKCFDAHFEEVAQ